LRAIEIGSIVYSSELQRPPLGSEAQYLLARYAFEALGYRRYEWKCDSLNASSRRSPCVTASSLKAFSAGI